MHCQEDETKYLDLHVIKQNYKISIPYNILCTPSNKSKNHYIPTNIRAVSDETTISLSWSHMAGATNNIENHLIFRIDRLIYLFVSLDFYQIISFFHSEGNALLNKIGPENQYFQNNLPRETCYQICIATIDIRHKTSRFSCQMISTEFRFTGPVTNVIATSESDKISISWSLPQFKCDVPQAYVVHLSGGEHICRVVIIKMVHYGIYEYIMKYYLDQ